VIIECTNCHAKYQYDEARFDGRATKKIKCAKCQSVFEIHNPAMESPEQTNVRSQRQPVATPEPEAEPRETGSRAADLQLPKGKRLSIAIIDGKDAGNVFRMEKPRVTIGRASADIVIDDTEASRQHAAVEVRDTIILLSDLDSTNGTLVDGRKITEPTELGDKGEFQIGSTTLMLIVTDEG
jgi:predicted Zn finger-like uncharacterized protein